MAQDYTKTTRPIVATGSEALSPPTDHLLGGIATSMPPAADSSAGMSPAENALRNTDDAMTTINLSNTWEGTLERIKWVMDTVNPVAEVRAMSFCQLPTEPNFVLTFQLHPYANIAYSLFFAIPKVICLRYCRMEMLILVARPF